MSDLRFPYEGAPQALNHGKMRLHLMRLAMRLFPSILMHMDVLHSAPLNAKMSASFLLNAAVLSGFS